MKLVDWDLGNVPPGIAWGGVDEAGRGAWAGPVVAACVVLDRPTIDRWRHVLDEVHDSKKLKPERREVLASELKAILPAWSVAEVDNLGIDRENILEATLAAMRQAIGGVQVKPRMLFIDGDRAPRSGLPERLVVDGDALSCAVACASILAKTHRDALLVAMETTYPGYGFAKHKGYGTPQHQQALRELGTCAVHRLSYNPVAAKLRPSEDAYVQVEQALEACTTHAQLQAWVGESLRPNYGRLRPIWVDALRDAYAQRLLEAVRAEAQGGSAGAE